MAYRIYMNSQCLKMSLARGGVRLSLLRVLPELTTQVLMLDDEWSTRLISISFIIARAWCQNTFDLTHLSRKLPHHTILTPPRSVASDVGGVVPGPQRWRDSFWRSWPFRGRVVRLRIGQWCDGQHEVTRVAVRLGQVIAVTRQLLLG